MNTNFSLQAIWSQGDLVSNLVAILLIVMSIATWTVILLKLYAQWRQKRYSGRVESFWHSTSLNDGLQHLGDHPENAFRKLAVDGVSAVTHLDSSSHHTKHAQKQLHDQLDLSDWVTRALRNSAEISAAKLQSGLSLLASIGSTAPFIGLFGTVWGIYHALARIGQTGQTSLDQVAGPIGEALVMTALGLAVAIPAVLAYNALLRVNKKISADLNRFAHDLHAYLVTGARIGKPTQQVA